MDTILKVEYKPYKTSQLAKLFNCSRKTFEKMITPYLELIGPKNGYIYSMRQVRIIFKALDRPYIIITT